ncbi:ABC transporter permease [Haematobacter missouriensis]|uniref:ABC transporter permease n=2 Tax=Haematobacter missouriensis TaxID=366616 RepID=A0A225D734_9RHOB|nr:ABC transporter permease [Haematobacter missouriensis]OWJ84510.1 ABC transporter permease [Haematobacter missouriensis]
MASGGTAHGTGGIMTGRSASVLPVAVLVALLIAVWYVAAVWMNATWTYDQAARAGTTPTLADVIRDTMAQDRPKLPAPHQVAGELWRTVAGVAPTSRRSLLYHAWITLSATLAGFAIGTAAGLLLAIGIVYSRAMEMSVMPWAIASQAIPILAIAPMIIVVLNSVGVSGLLPKAVIAAYLSFFPVVVGMAKGLRSPEASDLDLMRTYSASGLQTFVKLRLPASLPWLFTALKVAAAAALVGAIVGEMPTGAVAGLGARLLSGSYYGQTVQIWAALFMAALLAAVLVAVVGLVQRVVLGNMGLAR